MTDLMEGQPEGRSQPIFGALPHGPVGPLRQYQLTANQRSSHLP